MDKKERKELQKRMANVFLEMGMDLDLIAKISGLSVEDIKTTNSIDKEKGNQYNNDNKTKNDSY